MGSYEGRLRNSQRLRRNRWALSILILIQFTHEGHKGSINDLSWNHHEMLLGSTEEDENTLQFYQMVRKKLLRQIIFTSLNTHKMSNIYENNALHDFICTKCFIILIKDEFTFIWESW